MSAYKVWTLEEDRILIHLWMNGWADKDIALEINRGTAAIHCRKKHLGLRSFRNREAEESKSDFVIRNIAEIARERAALSHQLCNEKRESSRAKRELLRVKSLLDNKAGSPESRIEMITDEENELWFQSVRAEKEEKRRRMIVAARV